MNTKNTDNHKSQTRELSVPETSNAAMAGAMAPLRLNAFAEKTMPVKQETQEDLLFGSDAPENFVAIVELDEDTKALVQEEFGQEEGSENLSALFGGATPSYGVAALGLGGAMAGMPGSNDGNAQQALAANAGNEEPQSSGDASPFAPLLAAFSNAGNGAPDIPTAPTQADGTPEPDASGNTDADPNSSPIAGSRSERNPKANCHAEANGRADRSGGGHPA